MTPNTVDSPSDRSGMATSDELQASVDRHLGLLAESIRQDRQMLAYIDEQLEPLLRARRYAKVALAVLVSGGLWILALLTEPLLLIFATPLLLTTLGFSTSRCRPSGRTMISLLPP